MHQKVAIRSKETNSLCDKLYFTTNKYWHSIILNTLFFIGLTSPDDVLKRSSAALLNSMKVALAVSSVILTLALYLEKHQTIRGHCNVKTEREIRLQLNLIIVRPDLLGKPSLEHPAL